METESYRPHPCLLGEKAEFQEAGTCSASSNFAAHTATTASATDAADSTTIKRTKQPAQNLRQKAGSHPSTRAVVHEHGAYPKTCYVSPEPIAFMGWETSSFILPQSAQNGSIPKGCVSLRDLFPPEFNLWGSYMKLGGPVSSTNSTV